jgi:hypothetical protein
VERFGAIGRLTRLPAITTVSTLQAADAELAAIAMHVARMSADEADWHALPCQDVRPL